MIMKTTSLLRHASLVLGLAFCLANQMSAQTTASPAGLPLITSYVPAKAGIGESVLANLVADSIAANGVLNGPALEATHILLPTSLGMRAQVPVTYVTPTLIRFTLPNGAVTGATTLMRNTQSSSRAQASFTVVSFANRLAGFSVINQAQWNVGSMKTGSTELLPAGTMIPAGHAHFVPRALSSSKALPVTISFVSDQSIGISSVPLFSINEQVILPRGSVPSGLTLVKRVDLPLEPFTVTEVLGMSGNAGWRIHFHDEFQRMRVSSEGVLTLTPLIQGLLSPVVTLTVDENSARITKDSIRFRVRQNGQLVGPVISMAPPFDVIASNQIGPVSVMPANPASTSVPTPMLLRRGN